MKSRRKPHGSTYYPASLKPNNYAVAGCDHPDEVSARNLPPGSLAEEYLIDGRVGHTGAYAFRLFCPMKSRRKPHGSTYYPALLKPNNYAVAGCDHPDEVSARNLPPGSPAEEYLEALFTHAKRSLNIGITKPTLFSALPRTLPVPRGTIDCDPAEVFKTCSWAVLKEEVWKRHGEAVAGATPYLPGSFDRPPRNIAEKISSGYKAQECLTYFFGLGPGLLHGILPDIYWKNYCKIVRAYRIISQREIPTANVVEAYKNFYEAVEDVHQFLHFAPEIIRLCPGAYYTQWTMERTIANLEEELKQHSTPYANIAQRGCRRAQVNALKVIPDLEPPTKLPRGSEDLGSGYVLLRAKDEYNQGIHGVQGDAI
ncbi:hypothetical protein C8F04DRAFT_1289045 [Mycena alexandri]|uniref:Uncharacterized protein n=1 Tax=Mycena alexandri TaxID=1745969 RepID=A0AAD6SJB8_9AGAR|nr:hypothetical protein C8F04DRAFT_1289045 [Mycena alexandri]